MKNYNCGIYRIRNIINNKCYIGQSINLYRRKNNHFCNLRNNRNKNRHLQNSYNKYGEENFVFEILIYCEPIKKELTKYERFFDNYYKELNLSYNIREIVDSNAGWIPTNETKEKMSKSRQNLSGINNPFYGKRHTEESKILISQNHADFSGENSVLYGGHPTEETRQLISKHHADVSGNKNPRFLKMSEVIEIKEYLDLGMSIASIQKKLHRSYNCIIKARDGWYNQFYNL